MTADILRAFNKNEFQETSVSVGGYTGGTIYKRKSDERKFLLKKNLIHSIATEYIMGGIYKKLLGENCPETIIVYEEDNHQSIGNTTQFLIGSAWYENLKTLKEIDRESKKDPITSSAVTSSYRNSSGLELVIITSALCGEADFNWSNIGVIPAPDNPEKGFSVIRYDFAFSETCFRPWFYLDCIPEFMDGLGIVINSNFLKEKMQQVSDLPIKSLYDIIDQRIDCLRAANFNFGEAYDMVDVTCLKRSALYEERHEKNPKIRRCDIKLTAEEFKYAYKEFVKSNFDSLKEFNKKINYAIKEKLIDTTNNNWILENKNIINAIKIPAVNAVSSQLTQGISSLAAHPDLVSVSLTHQSSPIKGEETLFTEVTNFDGQ